MGVTLPSACGENIAIDEDAPPVLPEGPKSSSRRVYECAKFAHICSGLKGYILIKTRFNLLRCFKILLARKIWTSTSQMVIGTEQTVKTKCRILSFEIVLG